MKRYIMSALLGFALLPLFTACGEDELEDVNLYEWTYANETLHNRSLYYTAMGNVTTGSTYATFTIIRQSYTDLEFVYVVTESQWNEYSEFNYTSNYSPFSYRNNPARVEIPLKTAQSITVDGLKPGTTYYAFQSSISYFTLYKSDIGKNYKRFTTSE